MKKSKKVIVALMLATIMAAFSLLPAMQPMAVMATESQQDLEERGFVPVRETLDEDYVTITWNRAERNIHIAVRGVSIVFNPGSNVAYVNDIAVEMQHAVILQGGVSFIYLDDLILVIEAAMDAYYAVLVADLLNLPLTEEARDLVLYDFDFLMTTILENTPWESVINRRFDMDFSEYIAELRDFIYEMHPLTFFYTLEEFEDIFGMPLYEMWFPIRDDDDPRSIAANYLSYFLWSVMAPLEGIGHLFPRELQTYRIQYSALRISYHQGNINRETDPSSAMRHDTFTHPDVRWFYGDVEVDLYAEIESVFPEVPDNVTTEIITPGEVAYIRINSFATSAEYDDLVIAPFLEEVSDFNHLIIDIRGNGGGFMFNFTHNIAGRLIHEPVAFYSHQFFSGGDIAVEAMNALIASTQYWIDNVENNDVYQWYTIEVMPAQQFIDERVKAYFNTYDLEHLDYVLVERDWIFPTDDGITFDGKVWLLIDAYSASASSHAALMLMDTGLATVVGSNTSGVMATHHIYLPLPNTGLLFRIDLGYVTDAYGNSLEVYGIAPNVRNFFGMDALETVLELIANPYAAEEHREEIDLFDIFDLGFDVDFTGHPLIGTWAWDNDDAFIYEFRPDGTVTRGFDGTRAELYWYTFGNNLLIDVGFMIEHWTFTIEDGVLTIVSAQVPGLTWSYIWQ